MTFTAIHRAVGAEPGPLTDELLDEAVETRVVEASDLDWKRELPPAKGLPQTDYPKDVAAMANSGGGVIVYGVTEDQKAATGRVDVGELSEGHARAMLSAAITGISPPVFGLKVHRIGREPTRAVVVEVPASVDGPHLIYKNEYFGAPVRNDADTVWMKEPQIEAMYRARLDERRHAAEALDNLYVEAARGRDQARAWLVAVAHPRVPRFYSKLTRDRASEVFRDAMTLTREYADRRGGEPLDNVDCSNLRPGLRRWVAPNTATGEWQQWKEAWASIHQDGSVTLVAAIGGHRCAPSFDGSPQYNAGSVLESEGLECAVADFMALVRVTALTTGNDEYDVRVGVEWTGDEPLKILTVDASGHSYDGVSTPLHRFTPVEVTVNGAGSDHRYAERVRDLARDCVNQGGVSNLLWMKGPKTDET